MPTLEPSARRAAPPGSLAARELNVPAKVITVFSSKGGCGKTTLATNLAAVLAAGGERRVCVLDLDLAFGDVALALHLAPSRTIADAVRSRAPDAALIRSLLCAHSPGLEALVAPFQPEVAETISSGLVSNVLRLLRSQVDYVVVDTPPVLDDHVIEALSQSDLTILLATGHKASLHQFHMTLETLDLIGLPPEGRRAVMNRVSVTEHSARVHLEAAIPMPVAAFIPASRAIPASIERGQPIVLEAPDHPVSRAIFDFASRSVY